MKKTLVACMAIAALFALASGAGAITCTVDQRPAATLLVPYFEVAVNPDATPATGAAKFDTLVTIANASSAPMIAHVNVYNERSVLVLDYNVALTGFDVQAMSMAAVLTGNLPSTPIGTNHVGPDFSVDPDDDVCQRNLLAAVYPSAAGFLRIRPAVAATPDDGAGPTANLGLATSAYPVPAFQPGGPFAFQVLDSLDDTPDALECGDGTVDSVISGPIRGYITIDHANYCNLSNPVFPAYYSRDAMGNENNLWGEVIFVSGAGVGTFGGSTVNIESDRAFSSTALGGQVNQSDTVRTRTFYARYWVPSLELTCFGGNCAQFALTNPWNQGFGDEREPVGLRYAARYFEGNGVTSKFRVWRGSGTTLPDLIADGDCDDILPTVQLNFFDEDENGVSQIGPGPCPSPCTTPPPPSFNFPLETQLRAVSGFTLPAAFGGAQVGWVGMEFYNPTGPNAGTLDQAWVEYQFQGPAAFLSASAPATQLDPSTCNPLAGNVSPTNPSNTNIPGINVIIPTIPGGLTGEGCSLTLACTGTGP